MSAFGGGLLSDRPEHELGHMGDAPLEVVLALQLLLLLVALRQPAGKLLGLAQAGLQVPRAARQLPIQLLLRRG